MLCFAVCKRQACWCFGILWCGDSLWLLLRNLNSSASLSGLEVWAHELSCRWNWIWRVLTQNGRFVTWEKHRIWLWLSRCARAGEPDLAAEACVKGSSLLSQRWLLVNNVMWLAAGRTSLLYFSQGHTSSRFARYKLFVRSSLWETCFSLSGRDSVLALFLFW